MFPSISSEKLKPRKDQQFIFKVVLDDPEQGCDLVATEIQLETVLKLGLAVTAQTQSQVMFRNLRTGSHLIDLEGHL